eukprot:11894646-Alexandrium_andersonii.AAC.1
MPARARSRSPGQPQVARSVPAPAQDLSAVVQGQATCWALGPTRQDAPNRALAGSGQSESAQWPSYGGGHNFTPSTRSCPPGLGGWPGRP